MTLTIHESYYKALQRLEPADQLAALQAMMAYAFDGVDEEPEGLGAIVYDMAKPIIDSSRAKQAAGSTGGQVSRKPSRPESTEQSTVINTPISTAISSEISSPISSEISTGISDRKGKERKGKDRTGDKGEHEGERELLEQLPPLVRQKAEEWLQYKRERRENYQPSGLKALVGQIRNKTEELGEQVTIATIQASMASGYKGIIWDRASPPAPATAFHAFEQRQGPSVLAEVAQ